MSAIDTDRVSQVLDLRRLALPATPRVLELNAVPYVDSLGEDALRVDVVFDDAVTDDEIWQNKLHPIQTAISQALLDEGIRLFPYVFFARQAERAEMEQPSWPIRCIGNSGSSGGSVPERKSKPQFGFGRHGSGVQW